MTEIVKRFKDYKLSKEYLLTILSSISINKEFIFIKNEDLHNYLNGNNNNNNNENSKFSNMKPQPNKKNENKLNSFFQKSIVKNLDIKKKRPKKSENMDENTKNEIYTN